jgi:hypothetical protein
MNKLLTVATAGLVSLLLLAGCGGGDSSTPSSNISKAQFIVKGDLICKKADKQQADALSIFLKENPNGVSTTKEGQEEAVEALLVPSLKSESEDFNDLGAPSGDIAAEEIVGELEEVVGQLEDSPGKEQPEALFKKLNAKAKQYGFKACNDFL